MILKTIGSNMSELNVHGADILLSYGTPVAAFVNGACFRTEKYFSVTTSRHINHWLDSVQNVVKKPQSFFDNLMNGDFCDDCDPVSSPKCGKCLGV